MSFNIPSYEDRQKARAAGPLAKWVDLINKEILEGDWHDDGRFPYLHVEHGGEYIEDKYFDELKTAYDEQFWILERHSYEERPDVYTHHLRVFKKRREE